MRTLVLMRHATPESFSSGGDRARQLSVEGLDQAQQVGKALANLGLDLGLVSPAIRTRQTAQALGLEIPFEYYEQIYRDGSDQLRCLISEVDDAVHGLLLVGHAPALPGLAAQLAHVCGADCQDFYYFPTACYTIFRTPASWSAFADEDFSEMEFVGIFRP